MDKPISFRVSSTLAAYRIVKVLGNVATYADTITAACMGVTKNDVYDTNEGIEVQIGGIAKIEFGNHVTVGGLVAAGADGKGYKATGITLTNTFIIGTLVGPASATNSVSEVLINPYAIYGQVSAL